MKFTPEELEFLAAWAWEEKAADPYSLPAHLCQAAHQVKGVIFIRAIKAWAKNEGRGDEDIFVLHDKPRANWPWSSPAEMNARLTEAVDGLQAIGPSRHGNT